MSRMGFVCLGVLFALPGWAQQRVDGVRRVDPGAMYHHVYARVPMIGKGTPDDPKRPMFASTPPVAVKGVSAAAAPFDHAGILAYQTQLSDDGKWALVEFVGAAPKELEQITNSKDPNIKVFEQGKATKEEIEAEFQKYKKNFTFATSTTRVQ